jgi:hypothetical protein
LFCSAKQKPFAVAKSLGKERPLAQSLLQGVVAKLYKFFFF